MRGMAEAHIKQVGGAGDIRFCTQYDSRPRLLKYTTIYCVCQGEITQDIVRKSKFGSVYKNTPPSLYSFYTKHF